jgi:large subunit ribosomal protein L29
VKENKARTLRELTREEVELKLHDLQTELENLRFRAALKQETNPLRIREARREIARIHTLLCEDAHEVRHLAKRVEKKA